MATASGLLEGMTPLTGWAVVAAGRTEKCRDTAPVVSMRWEPGHAGHTPPTDLLLHFPPLSNAGLSRREMLFPGNSEKSHAASHSCQPFQLLMRRGYILCLYCVRRNKRKPVAWLL